MGRWRWTRTGRLACASPGEVPPGNYKIVYDFGSGTGKQKVVHIREDSEPQPTESPSSPPPESPTCPPESPTSPPESPTAPTVTPTTPAVTPTTPAVTPTTPAVSTNHPEQRPEFDHFESVHQRMRRLKFKQVPKAQVAAEPESLPRPEVSASPH